MTTKLALLLQIILPIGLLVWHARTGVRTFTAWVLLTCGIGAYIAATAVIGNWDVAPSYLPFLFLLTLGANTWYRDGWVRGLPWQPRSNDEWREIASCANVALAGGVMALVGVATRATLGPSDAIDTVTLNLYRQLASAFVGFVMFVWALRSPRAGRVLLSALFVWAAGTNLRVALTAPGDYLNFAQFAVLDVYRAFILGYFARHTAAIIAAIAVGQAVIAFLLAADGWPRRLGYVGAMVFLLAIVPLGTGSGFPATVLMALAAAEVLHADRYALFGRNVTATDAEVVRRLPGDDCIADPLGAATHAVTIFKPASAVWPWLVQMGAGRGGWYSYDRLDNGGHTSATRIQPDLQAVQLGAIFPALPGITDTFELTRLDVGHALVLAVTGPDGPTTTWAFVLEEPVAGVTRLIVRVRVARQPHPVTSSIRLAVLRFVHFVMERKQLNTLAVRVESA